jgi:O-antigen/teichoic acid export membrane protein
LSAIKKLAGQTLWYGLPTIASRFLGYATNILLFWLYQPTTTSYVTQIYAIIPFLYIIYTYGLETSYFKFSQTENKTKLYNTLLTSIIITTILLSAIFYSCNSAIANFVGLKQHPEYLKWTLFILALDTLSILPYAKLRQEERPRKYAFIRVFTVVINVVFTVFLLGICPKLYLQNPSNIWLIWYNPSIDIGYYIIANIISSALSLVLLYKEFLDFSFQFSLKIWKQVIKYSYPLIIVGFGGMINEMMSRVLFIKITPLSEAEAQRQLGIFGANYKLAILITIFIQVFKMGAEPFFFNQSSDKNAPKTYARVMKFFVIACCFMWLAIVLNLPLIKYFAYGKNTLEYQQGLHIIPILAMGSVFLGIYYNLSVWYKLTNKTLTGAYITLIGAAITIVLNMALIPFFGYTGSAWATFICYAFMMVISYIQGQKNYPIPYVTKKLIAYLVIVVLLYFIQKSMLLLWNNLWFSSILGLVLLLIFTKFIFIVESKELKKIPFINKFV